MVSLKGLWALWRVKDRKSEPLNSPSLQPNPPTRPASDRALREGEAPMYAAVRRYEGILDDAEAGRLVRDSFLPQLDDIPDSIA